MTGKPSIFAGELLDNQTLLGLSTLDFLEATNKIVDTDSTFLTRLKMLVNDLTSSGGNNAVELLFGLARRSKTVRKRLARDILFLDLLTARMVDICLLIAVGCIDDPISGAFQVVQTADLLENLMDVDPEAWRRHIADPGRKQRGRPIIWGPPERGGGEGPEPGSLIDRLQNLQNFIETQFDEADNPPQNMERNKMRLVFHARPDILEATRRQSPANRETIEKLWASRFKSGHDAPASCDFCGAEAGNGMKLQRCGKCEVAWYCGADGQSSGSECQRLAWKGHKKGCFEAVAPLPA